MTIPAIGFHRCTFLLLLLLLKLSLGVQLTLARTAHAQEYEQDGNSIAMNTMNRDVLKAVIDSRMEREQVAPSDFVQEIPLPDFTSNGISNEKREPRTKPEPRTTSRPRTLMERIERASSPSLYDQMRSKLQSLGVAVTEEQLSVVATKCGGQEPTLHYVQSYDFVRSAEHLCSGELLALVAVHSNAKNFERRATIRRTWGSLRYVGQFRIEVAFFLGLPASGDSDESGATGAQLRARIGAESDRFGDIVQLGFTENYRNLTIKHLGVYEWLLRHCRSAQYLVKVDDDTFTDVAHLATFLSKVAPPGLYCTATQGSKPHRISRVAQSKWAVSFQEFSGKFYPTYCEGFAYILHTKHVPAIYLCSFFKPFFWIDDVHMTGTLATSLRIPAMKFWKGHGFTNLLPSLASESVLDYIFLSSQSSTVFDVLWHKIWHSVLQYSLDSRL